METTKELPAEKQAMLEKWKTSGKRIKQYCMDESIPYYAMSYWQRKAKYLASGKDKKFIKVNFMQIHLLSIIS